MIKSRRTASKAAALLALLSMPSCISAFTSIVSRQPLTSLHSPSPVASTPLSASSSDSADEEYSDEFTGSSSAANSKSSSNSDETPETEEEFNSAAEEWAAQQAKEIDAMTKKRYVVVGAGWGGWGAAKALCEAGIDADITLIDALPDPTGATPYLSKTGKPVEAGTRGFWKDYPNINRLCAELNIAEEDVFTPYTNSSFYSPDGLEATAPVFGEARLPFSIPGFGDSDQPFPMLPSPLGQVLATFPLFERIPLADRASMVGLLLATVDCLGNDEATQMEYDRMSAHDLFVKFGLSKRLVEDFIKPTLLVGLFKPPEELSALVVMELLYYYALAHQDSFDVRWIKNGTVSDSLLLPLAERLTREDEEDGGGGLRVLGGCRVQEISLTKDAAGGAAARATRLSYLDTRTGNVEEIADVDGVVLALGCQGMRSVISSSPDLARFPAFSRAASLKGIDVISCRLYFDRRVATRSPANVFSRFPELRGAGGTFFMLDLLPSAVPRFADAKLVDSWVGKYAGVVSWFSPGSYDLRPPLEGAGRAALPNVKCAGDWVRMGDREHGAKGLCQERAYVSGIEAANSLMKATADDAGDGFRAHEVLPVREDERAFQLGVEANKRVMSFLPRFWTR